MVKYSKQQIYLITSAVLYLVGAVFMLVNAFAGAVWAFWVGLVFAVVATVFYILMAYFDKMQNRIEHGKQSTNTPAPSAPSTASDGTKDTPDSGSASVAGKGTKGEEKVLHAENKVPKSPKVVKK
jgi:hypothetical protein